jgi:hypothetical protein
MAAALHVGAGCGEPGSRRPETASLKGTAGFPATIKRLVAGLSSWLFQPIGVGELTGIV